MKTLRKIGAVGGAIVIAACWPFATGKIGEAIYTDAILAYDNPVLELELIEYDRGYLSSNAKSRLSIKDPMLQEQLIADGLPTELIFKHDISHGFMSLSSVSVPEITEETQQALAQIWADGDIPMTLTTESRLSGKTHINLTLAAVNAEVPDVDEGGVGLFSTSPFTLTGDIEPTGESDFVYSMPTLSFTSAADEKLTVNGLSGQGNGQMNGLFWIGQHQLTLGEIKISSADQTMFDMNDFRYSVTNSLNKMTAETEGASTEESATLTTNNVFSFEELIIEDVTVDKGKFDVSFSGLDYESLSQIFQIIDTPDEMVDEDGVKKLQLAIDLLFAKGMALSLNELSASVMNGSFTSQLGLEIEPGVARASQDASQLLEKLRGKGDVLLTPELVNGNPLLEPQIDDLIAMGMAEETEEGYRLMVTIDKGIATLSNGQEVPLFMLIAPIMQ
ncbi:YdgA family protein [Vibrio sp. Of7-15]|uniref:DUF945 family protein n=1 Tax=Vibrio sp. Of7-15 TaxID=2724879 RepID=UPI001EF2CBFD|nr:DUF945 family protein [Vibrio sp. Of7-15]MCG7497067.1 YdgA family protein [Vibrio sp. Of7-15]